MKNYNTLAARGLPGEYSTISPNSTPQPPQVGAMPPTTNFGCISEILFVSGARALPKRCEPSSHNALTRENLLLRARRSQSKNYIFDSKFNSKMSDSLTPAATSEITNSNAIGENKWYAVYTRPRAEKQVYERLVEEGIETFLPLHKTYTLLLLHKDCTAKQPYYPSSFNNTYLLPSAIIRLPQMEYHGLKPLFTPCCHFSWVE